MSASDLVPRVMLFVSDLERKNAELKSQLKEQEDKQLLVQLTGPNGTPIHYEGSLKDGYSVFDRLWCFDVEGILNNDVLQLPISLLFIDLEIWLSGLLIGNFQNVDRLYKSGVFTQDFSGSETGKGKIYFHPGGVTIRGRHPINKISASIGPMTYADYNKLTDEQLNFNDQKIALCDNLNFHIHSIKFNKDQIRGAMSLLEKLGIAT